MHRLRVPRACFSLLLPLSLATRLMWLGGCALLLFVTQASAGQVSLAWDAMSAPTLAGYRLYYGQTSRSYSANINIGLQTSATVTSLTAGQTYYFAVTAYDSTGMGSPFSNEVNTTIPTTAPPVATFSATPTTGPAPLPVQFTDTSTGSLSTWAWSFGDGTSSTTQNPQHTYSTTGTYTVSLTVSGPGGANTATKANYITTVKTNPTGLVAAYSFDEGSGTTVTDVSGYGNHGTITGATWTTAGKFGGALAFNGTSNWVTVKDAPSLDLTTGMTLEAWVYPTVTSTHWTTVVMKEQSSELVYSLYAGSGSSVNPPYIYVFASFYRDVWGPSALPLNTWSHLAGTYDGTTLRLYVNGSQIASGTDVGTIGTSTQPLRIGGNSVWGEYFQGRLDEVRIYNRALSTSEIQADMQTPMQAPDPQPPTVAITAPATGATVSGTVVSVAAAATDNVGVVGVQFLLDGVNLGSEVTTAPYSIAWNTTTAPNGTHSLAAVARDAAGNRATAATVTVTVSNLLPPPVANFIATPTTGPAPLPVQFTDTSTGSLSTWAWSFGDGTSSTTQNPQHTYNTAGSYTVSLKVTGPGGSATKTAAITVTMPPPPVANFSATPTTGPAPLPVQFTDTSTGSITAWAWSFGDGTSSTAQNPQHTYSTAGTYPVSLKVTGPGGSATKAAAITVTVPPPPVANFSATPTTGPAPLLVTFTDTSTGSLSTWAWSFGDGTSSTTRSPQHTYSTTGTYTVSLTVSGPGGTNTATKVKYITVKTNPTGLVAAYSFDEGSGTTVTDVSGYGNHGTITGATWTTAGKFGGALAFNGTSNWVTVKDAPSLDLTTGMTLEAWVYPTVTSTHWTTVVMKEQSSELVYSLYAGSGSSVNPPYIYVFASFYRDVWGPSALPLNTWSHLAGTYDGTTLRLYVNGSQIASGTDVGTIGTSTQPLRIGGNSVWGEYFQGRLDEVRIYNRALSASEIRADMSTPINVLNSVSLLP